MTDEPVDGDDFEELLESEAIDERREGSRPCPVCSRLMDIEVKHAIAIDVCPEHGIWLDSGELEKLVLDSKRNHVRDRIRNRRKLDAVKHSGRMEGAMFGWWSMFF